MNGHVRKRGGRWEIMWNSASSSRNAAACTDTLGRGRRHWIDKGRLDCCPKCGGALDS